MRPVRERSVERILKSIRNAVKFTGIGEISLLSLSTSDYSEIKDLLNKVMSLSEEYNLVFSLPPCGLNPLPMM